MPETGSSPPHPTTVTPPASRQVTFDEVIPRADSMMESLRAFGYSLPNALADLVDNSINAEAKRIEVVAHWEGPRSWIRVSDNGCGMAPDRLLEAMRLGSRSPLEARTAGDLGRFGLGLKTASLSQGRRLTVHSKADGCLEATRCWDLDVIQQVHHWALINGTADGTDPANLTLDPGVETGTVVLWEKLDRVVSNDPAENQAASRRFWAQVSAISEHLGVVFHQFLSGPKAIQVRVNEIPVKPWDPYLTGSSFTQRLPSESLGVDDHAIHLQPYVLPHESKLSDEERKEGEGLKGWNAQQGFYVYRNRRLLVAGDWLGMYRQEDPYRLARIEVDIQNASDMEWKIDVRKAQAVPPEWARSFLRRNADATREQAFAVYRHRGKVMARERAKGYSYLWQEVLRQGKVHYSINREHPAVRAALEQKQISRAEFESLLKLIEETTPVPLIIAHFTANTEHQGAPFENLPTELKESLVATVQILRQSTKLPAEQVRKMLLSIEPFGAHTEAVMSMDIDGAG